MPPPSLPTGWKEYTTSGGEKFFHNASTQQSQYVRPERQEFSGLEEGDEEEEEQDDGYGIVIQPLDIPQAFSHFTYTYSKRKKLVCDLQGVLNEACNPPLFELTDPVIHYKSETGQSKQVYGRTDRGMTGVIDFFNTHNCSPLCHAMNKKWAA